MIFNILNLKSLLIMFMFVNTIQQPNIKEQIQDIENELGFGNQYLFLRSIWKSHSHMNKNSVVDFDDQLDRLNKIVAMMKKHISISAKKQLNFQNATCYQESTLRQCRALEAMNKAFLEAQQYRTRLSNMISENEEMKRINQELKEQILFFKKKKKQDTLKIKQLTQKNVELSNKILATGFSQYKSVSTNLKTSRKTSQDLNDITSQTNIPFLGGDKKNSKSRYSHQQTEESERINFDPDADLDTSIMSITSYGFSSSTILQKFNLNQQNKENLEISDFISHCQSQKEILKLDGAESCIKNEKSKGRRRTKGESPGQKIKFIRQNSKKTLLVKTQKCSQNSAKKQ